jgi:pimeloyl-ACP methyl ester carboxylesterase
MIPMNETFNGSFPFVPHFTSAPSFQMHYVDQGEGDVVLCLHGEPTWGYLFRHIITQLSDCYRVIVPDHMGFGKSETPPDRNYWLQDHVDNIERLVIALDLRGITLVMHDFGGPVGMGLASRQPDRIRRVISLNGPTPFGQPELEPALQANTRESPWFQWVVQAEAAGRLEQVLSELHYHILSTLKLNGFERNELITETWIDAYRTPFSTPAETRGAIGWAKGFATGAHIFETPSSEAQQKIGKLPALAIWGNADRTLRGKYFLPLFRWTFPSGIIHELPGVGHYSPEDAPEIIGPLIRQFLE